VRRWESSQRPAARGLRRSGTRGGHRAAYACARACERGHVFRAQQHLHEGARAHAPRARFFARAHAPPGRAVRGALVPHAWLSLTPGREGSELRERPDLDSDRLGSRHPPAILPTPPPSRTRIRACRAASRDSSSTGIYCVSGASAGRPQCCWRRRPGNGPAQTPRSGGSVQGRGAAAQVVSAIATELPVRPVVVKRVREAQGGFRRSGGIERGGGERAVGVGGVERAGVADEGRRAPKEGGRLWVEQRGDVVREACVFLVVGTGRHRRGCVKRCGRGVVTGCVILRAASSIYAGAMSCLSGCFLAFFCPGLFVP
jgi:hypothetical protein